MNLKNFLIGKTPIYIQFFRGCILGMGLSAAAYTSLQFLPGEDLSDGDKQSLTDVFNDSINIDDINYHRSPFGNKLLRFFGADGVTVGNTVITNYKYSKGTDVYKYVLIHEAAHIWQNQNCPFNIFNNLGDEIRNAFSEQIDMYKYHLDDSKDLRDYNHEQQASIIADYFMPHIGASFGLVKNKFSSDAEKQAVYDAVMKNFLNDPKYIQKHCL